MVIVLPHSLILTAVKSKRGAISNYKVKAVERQLGKGKVKTIRCKMFASVIG